MAAALIGTATHAQVRTPPPDDIALAMQAGRWADALQRVDAALADKPKDPQLRFQRAVALNELKRGPEAIVVLLRLTEDHPELAEPWNNLAVLYAADGQLDKARAALEIAVRTRPDYATAFENLGDVYARLAAQSYDKAQTLDGRNAPARRKLALARDVLLAPATSGAPSTSKP